MTNRQAARQYIKHNPVFRVVTYRRPPQNRYFVSYVEARDADDATATLEPYGVKSVRRALVRDADEMLRIG